MRHDTRNTGRSEVAGRWHGDRPWSFATGRGIFSTAVIGADETVYIGSADGVFYALDARGRPRWRLRTGGIIDAAGAISRFDRRLGTAPLTFGSGDERLYHVRTDPGPLPRSRRILWTYRATRRPATAQLVNWWEGNVGLAPDGTIMAGNTGGAAYALTPAGRLRWSFQTQNSVWTTPAFGRDGSSYWGSLDFRAFALDRDGRERWSRPAAGYFVASPAIAPDGTVYTASFDRSVYALDPATGAVRWSFRTGDHVYASPALGRRPATVYAASTDGSVYALRPDGRLRWRYDTGDAVRSSPVVGLGPGGRGEIVYVGSSDGVLYALDAATGRRRWSFDTTPRDPVLRDRNDLNGSPALGPPRRRDRGRARPRLARPLRLLPARAPTRGARSEPGPPLGRELSRVLPVTSGGSTLRSALAEQAAAAVLNARLVVRRGGVAMPAAMQPLAGGARPRRRWTRPPRSPRSSPATASTCTSCRAGSCAPARATGCACAGATPGGGWTRLGTARGASATRCASAPRRAGRSRLCAAGRDAVSALSLRRIALPMPAVPDQRQPDRLRQLRPDRRRRARGAAPRCRGRAARAAVGRRRRAAATGARSPTRAAASPSRCRGACAATPLILTARDLRLTFSFGHVPLRRFELRARLRRDLGAAPGAALYAEVTCADVPVYGAALQRHRPVQRDRHVAR